MFSDTAWKRIENRVKRGEAKLEAMLKMTQVAREELTAAAAAKKQLQLPTRSRQSNAFNLEEDLYILEWIVAQVKVRVGRIVLPAVAFVCVCVFPCLRLCVCVCFVGRGSWRGYLSAAAVLPGLLVGGVTWQTDPETGDESFDPDCWKQLPDMISESRELRFSYLVQSIGAKVVTLSFMTSRVTGSMHHRLTCMRSAALHRLLVAAVLTTPDPCHVRACVPPCVNRR